MVSRRRLDAELVRRGLAASRSEACAVIDSGAVVVGGALATKATRLVAAGEPIVLAGPPPRYVGRGGEKLEAALAAFDVDVEGRRVLDVGASTGGFTDCLLQHGAAHVTALDVGHGQIHERLRADPRVAVVERTNIRHVRPGEHGEPFEVAVADVSFISLTVVLPALVPLLTPSADLVLLVKPQFEAGRAAVSRGRGVISDPSIWADAVRSVAEVVGQLGAGTLDAIPSPLRGAEGNVEVLLHARVGEAHRIPPDDLAAAVVSVVSEVSG